MEALCDLFAGLVRVLVFPEEAILDVGASEFGKALEDVVVGEVLGA